MVFYTLSCLIEHKESKDLVIKNNSIDNIYMLNLEYASMHGTKCLVAKGGDFWLWHRLLSHVHFDLISKISSKNMVTSLPKIKLSNDKLCDTCQLGKQTRVLFESNFFVSMSKYHELLHLNSRSFVNKKFN